MSKKICLNKGYYVIVDDEDYEWVNKWKWHVIKIGHTINHNLFYATRTHYYGTENGKKKESPWYMHRIIIGAKKGQIVDHINNDGLDNRKSNLRIVTHRQNQLNRVQKTSSKYPGVYLDKDKKKFRSSITVNKKRTWLGTFDKEIDAAWAYWEALSKIDE